VLHATASIRATLANVRKLLKPGGKLILFEIVQPEILRAGFAFGLLQGWWLSTDSERQHGPCMSVETWDKILKETGFSGTDFVLDDYQDLSCRETSIIISTAVEHTVEEKMLKPIMILINPDSEYQQDVAGELCKTSEAESCQCLTLDQLHSQSDIEWHAIISLLELDETIFPEIDNSTFDDLKHLFSTSTDLLWTTQGSHDSPEAEIVIGLARTLRSERHNFNFVTLALNDGFDTAEMTAEKISICLKANEFSSTSHIESEYRVEQREICVGRLGQLIAMNEMTHQRLGQYKLQAQQRKFGQCPPLSLNITTPGLLDTLHFIEDEVRHKPLSPNEVEIEVRVVDMNFMDVLTVMGQLNQTTLGGACAGMITRIGSQVEDLGEGDRVAACILGCMRTYARQRRELVVRIPNTMSFVEAAALPCTYVTAYHGLVEFARLQAGETVLIHSAAGGTGQSAIQVAKLLGAEIYATVGSNEKKALLMDEYAIPEDHVFYSRDASFASGVMRVTANRGVDVVINSLSGDKLEASWECMAPFGRFVEIGKKDIHGHSHLPMFPFAQNVSFHCLDLASMSVFRPGEFGRSLRAVIRLATEKKLRPSRPISIYPVSEITEAFRYLQSGKNVGKTVVELGKNDVVSTRLRLQPEYAFDANATYVIAGGLGGLGRCMAKWMCQRGARNLILLSRSGPRDQTKHTFLRELRQLGVRVEAPACDITCYETLAATIETCLQTMPVIKGCIQSTMVLKVSTDFYSCSQRLIFVRI
jgi:NADPH:quinone reductase-like Zn-dependent oxidoreductase